MGRRRFTAAAASGDHGLLLGLGDDDHTQYFLANCTRAFAGDPIPDGADTRSLGSAARELRNLYLGDAGAIYFGLAQDVALSRYSANAIRLSQDDYLAFIQSALGVNCLRSAVAGDIDFRHSTSCEGIHSWGPGNAVVDVSLFRGAANRLDLATGDSLNLVLGDITLAATRLVDGVDPSMYTKFVLQWHGRSNIILGGATTYIASDGEVPVESPSQYPVPEACVAVALYVRVSANTLSGATSVTLRRNGAGTAVTLSIPGGATGTFSNVANNVAFAAGDLASIQVVAGADGTNDIRLDGITVKFAQSAA